MRPNNLIAFLIVLFASQPMFSAPKFPFPQDQKYPYGIKPAGANHNDVQAAYDLFLKNYYEEQGDLARIKWDIYTQTVSEGIGYGMIIMAYMDNAVNNTQPKFDKLWNYYKKFPDDNGLMHWKINGFNGMAEANGATDGDIDVAFALNLAYYQWNDEKYKTAAKDIMGKIYAKEVDPGSKLLYPGDKWTDPKNPSYIISAALGLFNQTKFDGNDWSAVKTANYDLLKKCAHGTTGLVPDWCNNDGTANSSKGADYRSDAARTPWRMALAYAWYGDQAAKDIAGKMAQWIKTSTNGDPSLIMDGYKLDGTKTGTFNIPMYIGPFACAGMVDASHQAWLNASYTRLASFIDNTGYYNESLKLLTLLLLTGNCLNFKDAAPKTEFTITTSVSPANAGTVTKSPDKATYALNSSVTVTAVPSGANKFTSWGGDLKGTNATQTFTITCDMNITAYFNAGSADLVDDCEDGNNLTRFGSKWFTYNDSTNKGTSVVDPKTTDTKLFVMADGGATGSKKAAKISYTLGPGATYNPYVGIGFGLNPTETVVDISSASGLTFYFKGDTTDIRVETSNIKDFGYFFKRLDPATEWKLISLKWSDFAQAPWAVKADFDRTKATKIAWQTPNVAKAGKKGEIWIDEIHLPGYSITVDAKKQAAIAGDREFFISLARPSAITVGYTLQNAGAAEIAVYDFSGDLVEKKSVAGMQPGYHTATFDFSGTGRVSGAYIIQLKAGARSLYRTLTLTR